MDSYCCYIINSLILLLDVIRLYYLFKQPG